MSHHCHDSRTNHGVCWERYNCRWCILSDKSTKHFSPIILYDSPLTRMKSLLAIHFMSFIACIFVHGLSVSTASIPSNVCIMWLCCQMLYRNRPPLDKKSTYKAMAIKQCCVKGAKVMGWIDQCSLFGGLKKKGHIYPDFHWKMLHSVPVIHCQCTPCQLYQERCYQMNWTVKCLCLPLPVKSFII